MKDTITYRNLRIYKYHLVEPYAIETDLDGFVGHAHQHGNKMVEIDSDGLLFVSEGYLWDGPSGCARDTLTFMRASLVHDALYHLLREEVLPKNYRKDADNLMRKLCLQDGMFPLKAAAVWAAVRLGGRRSAEHDKPSTIRTAPRVG